jgi:hypothetical protein
MALRPAPLKTGDEAEGEAEAVPEGMAAEVAEVRAEETQGMLEGELTGATVEVWATPVDSVSGQIVVVISVLDTTVEKAGVAVVAGAEVLSVSGQIVVLSVVSTVVVAAPVAAGAVVLTTMEEPPAAAPRPNWVEYWYWPVPSTTRRRP